MEEKVTGSNLQPPEGLLESVPDDADKVPAEGLVQEDVQDHIDGGVDDEQDVTEKKKRKKRKS